MGTASGLSRELTLELEEADELFVARPSDVASGAPPLPSAVDRIREQLNSGRIGAPAATVIVLPRSKVHSGLESGLQQALARYCEIGIREAENGLKATHREGRRVLLLGMIVLAVSLGLSAAVLQSHFPSVLRTFLGEGLFAVAAWVGMWYPLDTLLYSGRPYRRERKMLRAIQGLEITLRASD